MSLTIAQNSAYRGDERWSWSVWLKGPSQILDRVRYVEWILHPTFVPPVRRKASRKTCFRLTTGGWGEFVVRATVQWKTGDEPLELRHRLKLRYEPSNASRLPTRTRPTPLTSRRQEGGAKPRVFLSYRAADAHAAAAAKKILSARDIEWADAARSIEAGGPFRTALHSAITGSDALLELRSGTTKPPEWESSLARAAGIPVHHVRVEDFAEGDSRNLVAALDGLEKLARSRR